MKLHDHVLQLADPGFSIGIMDIKCLAAKLANASAKKSFAVGGGWVDGFRNQWPDLSRLQTTGLKRNIRRLFCI